MNSSRYIRQTILDVIGDEGQARLSSAHIVIVGCGGLGNIAAPYLAGAGIGRITLIDGDTPDQSNLHRQIIFYDENGKKTKSELLGDHIMKLNPEIEVYTVPSMISKKNIEKLIPKGTLVLECTDNIQAKYLVNDYCHIHRIPMIYGAIHKYDGYVSTFLNRNEKDIHLRDIFAEPNNDIPSCSEVGVMGPLAGLIGILQANETIKSIVGMEDTLSEKLLTYNILSNDQMKLKLKKTFDSDMEKLFRETEYNIDLSCEIPEISIEDFWKNKAQYLLVSILEDDEHEYITEDTVRLPLSSFDEKKLTQISHKEVVFYCLSGKRSAALVNRLNKGISLKGGLNAFKQKKQNL